MKAYELPGYAPGHPERDYDLDKLTGGEEVRMGTFRPYPYNPPDDGWVQMLMQAMSNPDNWPEEGLPPVIAWEGHQDPHDIITGRHRLTAAFRLGWTSYPAYLVGY